MAKKTGWWVSLASILALEIIGIVWVTWLSLKTAIGLMKLGQNALVGGQVAITLILVMSTIWVFATLRGAILKKHWVRASNFTIQVLMLAAATGVLQGIIGSKPVGWVMLFLSLTGLLCSIALSKKPRSEAEALPDASDSQ